MSQLFTFIYFFINSAMYTYKVFFLLDFTQKQNSVPRELYKSFSVSFSFYTLYITGISAIMLGCRL